MTVDQKELPSFDALGLSSPILQALKEQRYDTPTPIQAAAIPAVMNGADVMGAAQTGTGKTAGFTLPILEKLYRGHRPSSNQVHALVITPTRELAAQVGANIATYARHLPIRSAVVFGGVKINPQMMKLRKGADILVATPGRLLDLYQQNAVRFDQLSILVLDEADRMLDMGVLPDIRRIMDLLPKERQTLLFSATFSEEIRRLAKGIVHDPVEISVTPKNTTVSAIDQWVCPVDKKRKSALLTHLIDQRNWNQVLVFTRTKHGANKLTKQLMANDIPSAAIHGNKSQGARTRALSEFKEGKTQVLVATDIAARGLDIHQLPHVVNFDLPSVAEDYVHRIGRTGRAGAVGEAVSLVSADEAEQLENIETLIRRSIPREACPGFEPIHDVPPTRVRAAKKPSRPKKTKPKGHHRSKPASHRPEANGNSNEAPSRKSYAKKKSSGQTTRAGNSANRKSNSRPLKNRAGE